MSIGFWYQNAVCGKIHCFFTVAAPGGVRASPGARPSADGGRHNNCKTCAIDAARASWYTGVNDVYDIDGVDMTDTQPVVVEMGMDRLRDALTDAVDLAKHGTPVRVMWNKRLMCYLVPPALAEKCLKIEAAEQE